MPSSGNILLPRKYLHVGVFRIPTKETTTTATTSELAATTLMLVMLLTLTIEQQI